MNHTRMNRLLTNAADPEYSAAVDRLRSEARTALDIRYEIGPRERCNWSHYYYCPKDGTKLAFAWKRSEAHECPFCGAVWKGEPYDGAWSKLAHERMASGARSAAIYGFVADDEAKAHWAARLLLSYTEHYSGFEIHGNVPYNGPGKLFAQTLDEAHWIFDLCDAYRFVRHKLTPSEDERIRSGLLYPCASFLIANQESQIHNHAVLIASAIVMLGSLLGDDDILRDGLERPCGLHDQLTRGTLEDGLWYEGSFHYHYYMLESLLRCAVLLEDTDRDLRNLPILERLFDCPLDYIQPDGLLPNLNDASSPLSLAQLAPCYEIAYGWYKKERYADVLRLAYGMDGPGPKEAACEPIARSSVEALVFGLPLGGRVPACGTPLPLERFAGSDASSASCGLTKLVNRKGWHLLVKHSPFGGEHDHMDRLGLSFSAGSVPLFVDPGTTAYAVPVHYGWFKHTYSHNTIAIDGQDQPPVDGERIQFRREEWGAWVESRAFWGDGDGSCRMKPAIHLPREMCSWNEEAYRGVALARINALTDEALLDVVKISVPAGRRIDLLYHMSGEPIPDGDTRWTPWSGRMNGLSPEWMDELRRSLRPGGGEMVRWRMRGGELLQAGWCSRSGEVFTARTPDNPPTGRRCTWIRSVRGTGEDTIFVNAFVYADRPTEAAAAESGIEGSLALGVEAAGEGRWRIALDACGVRRTWMLDWREASARMKIVHREDSEG